MFVSSLVYNSANEHDTEARHQPPGEIAGSLRTFTQDLSQMKLAVIE